MKITNAEVIKIGEQDLIDAITADLDWGAIEEIFLKEHNLEIEEDIEYKKGDIISLNDRIAYKLEFEVKVNLSVLLDREGEYISVTVSGKKENDGADKVEEPIEEPLTEVDIPQEDGGNSLETIGYRDDSYGDITQMETQVEAMIEKISNETQSDSLNNP